MRPRRELQPDGTLRCPLGPTGEGHYVHIRNFYCSARGVWAVIEYDDGTVESFGKPSGYCKECSKAIARERYNAETSPGTIHKIRMRQRADEPHPAYPWRDEIGERFPNTDIDDWLDPASSIHMKQVMYRACNLSPVEL